MDKIRKNDSPKEKLKRVKRSSNEYENWRRGANHESKREETVDKKEEKVTSKTFLLLVGWGMLLKLP